MHQLLKILAVALLPLPALPLPALSDISFGPNPRALDNLAVFDTSIPLRAQEWAALRQAGVKRIDLNATALMRTELGRGQKKGKLVQRYPGTYLDDADLKHLRARVRDGFEINYQAGIGLSAERCAVTDPVRMGQDAARMEYIHVIQHLHRARIPVTEINVDGPFLRLLEGSGKSTGCANGVKTANGKQVSFGKQGKSMAFTAIAVHHYMAELRRHVAKGQNKTPQMGLTLNLPNWRVGPLKPAHWRRFDAQLSDMLETFRSVPGATRHNLRWITVDYPYCYLRGTRRCGNGKAQAFVTKMNVLWAYSRKLNGDNRPPKLALIANDIGQVDACVPKNERPLFLAYRDYRKKGVKRSANAVPASAFTAPTTACQIAQRDGPDTRFISASFDYATRVQRGDLAKALRKNIPDFTVSRISFQSWGLSPMSNLWYINQIRNYAQGR